jgi:hypothetical protein
LRLLRASLVLGALYDFGFAAAMLAAPAATAAALRLPLPGERFFLQVLAVLLAMLGALYLAAARDPRRLSAVIAIAIAGRLAGAAVLALNAGGRPDLANLWWLAAADGVLGIAHAAAWLPLRE